MVRPLLERSTPDWLTITTLLAALIWSLMVALGVRGEVLHHIRTLNNLIDAAGTRDYSVKGAGAREPGELAALYRQLNSLQDILKTGRQSEQELLHVLEKVVDHIDVAIIVCDSHDRIRLVNALTTTLLKSSAEALIGLEFARSPLAGLPLAAEPRLLDYRFPGGESRWQVSQQYYRHQGQPSRLIFITDLKQVLVEQETAAWQRLIRVISHEVNNSLTPITSLCQTLVGILDNPAGELYANDVRDGLGVIGQRAKGLKEFISVYAQVARLPEPQKMLFPAAELLEKVQGIFTRDMLEVEETIADVRLFGDPIHLEQALINLIKNALEANITGTVPVKLSCSVRGDYCEFEILDEGAGVSNPGNLFVPFYTTKREGGGIGLVLCRQIAAKHFGQVTLDNRPAGRGAVARLILPLPMRQRGH